MNEEISDLSVFTHHISARQARRVARALREAGYGTATAKNCNGHVINVARYFEPADVQAHNKLLRIICNAAGIQPREA